MAASRSRIRPASGRARWAKCTSTIFAIRTATNSVRCIGWSRAEAAAGADQPQQEERAMRVAVFAKATEDSEAGIMPPSQLLEEMGAYNQKLIEAGMMQAG